MPIKTSFVVFILLYVYGSILVDSVYLEQNVFQKAYVAINVKHVQVKMLQ